MYNMCNYLQKCENDVRQKVRGKILHFFLFWPFWPFSQIFSFIHLHLMSHSKAHIPPKNGLVSGQVCVT